MWKKKLRRKFWTGCAMVLLCGTVLTARAKAADTITVERIELDAEEEWISGSDAASEGDGNGQQETASVSEGDGEEQQETAPASDEDDEEQQETTPEDPGDILPDDDLANLSPAERLIRVAQGEVGYTESENNETKYNNGTSAWCSEFVSWCAGEAGISRDIIPWCSSYTAFRRQFSAKGRYYTVINGRDNDTCGCNTASGGLAIPVTGIKPGDIILVSTNSTTKYTSGPNHTALCVAVEGEIIYTIEGNVGSEPRKVMQLTRRASEIHGVCRPSYNTACLTGDTHNWTVKEQNLASSCNEQSSTVYECSDCHMTRTETSAGPAHQEQILPAVKATCLATGLTEGRVCTVCGTVTVPQTTIEKLPVPQKGEVLVNEKNTSRYQVTKAGTTGGTVSYLGPVSSNVTSMTITGTVTIDGIQYKVTSIAAKAFYNCRKLKSVTIGKNVKKIGKMAFYGCKKLKKITVKTKLLKKKRIGKNAFKNISAKTVFDVPNSKISSYRKIFRARGAGNNTKFK